MRFEVEVHGRVWGPPGTGKTTQLVRDSERFIRDGKRVLALTYTTSAAEEMKQRIGMAHDFMRAWGTIHSAALRSLPPDQTNNFRGVNYTFSHFARAYRLPYDPSDPFSPKLGNRVLAAYQYAVGKYYPETRDDVKAVAMANFYGDITGRAASLARAYARWKHAQREEGHPAYDFTDMLIEALSWGEPWDDYDYVLIDEAQDVSPLEWAVVTKLFDPSKIILYGDPMQNIYESLTGADSNIFLKVQPAEVDMVLSKSYRLPRKIWQFALRFVRMAGMWDDRLEDVEPRMEGGEIYCARLSVSAVRKFADEGKEVAVLTRTNRGARALLKTFLRAGIIPRTYKQTSRLRALEYLYDVEEWIRDSHGGKYNYRAVQAFLRLCEEQDIEILRSPLYSQEFKIKYVHRVILPRLIGVPVNEHTQYYPNVVVDTIHAAKGREADVVFVDVTDQRVGYDAFEARVRYVAVTRTRGVLFVRGV